MTYQKFSDRMGITTPKLEIQYNSMDRELTTSLWNKIVMRLFHESSFLPIERSRYKVVLNALWIHYWKLPIDDRPGGIGSMSRSVKKVFFQAKWYEKYNIIQFIIENLEEPVIKDLFKIMVNESLEEEFSGYRVVDNVIMPITSEDEIETVETAISKSSPFKGVHIHLEAAAKYLSQKKKPDYRNSIKESILAVESLAKEITEKPNATLGDALKILEKNHDISKTLKQSFSKLYGYSSSDDGIRHALLEESKVSFAEAKFMFIACSAFINYLIDIYSASVPSR